MSLLEEARAEVRLKGDVCSVAAFLPDPDLEEALAAVRRKLLNEPGVALDGTALSRALEKRGIHLSGGTLRRHATGGCTCRR